MTRNQPRVLRWMLLSTMMVSSFVIGTGPAHAASCSFDGPSAGGSWHFAGNWSCGLVPGSADVASIGNGETAIVDADADIGALLVSEGGVITFTDETTLAAGTFGAARGALRGTGTVTVAGAFTAAPESPAFFEIANSVDLVLNGPSSHDTGEICVATLNGSGDSTLQINNTFTIGADTGVNPFACSTTTAAVHVGPDGHLIKAGDAPKTSFTGIDNDGTITVEGGTFVLQGGASGAASDGAYLANDGATLEFQGSPPLMGATSRFGGDGTIHVNALGMDMAAGGIIDPQIFRLTGTLRLHGTDPVDLPVFNLTRGTLDSDRPVTAHVMNVTGGTLQNDFVLTVAADGSFSKTTFAGFNVRDVGPGSADLVLNADATLDGGFMCVAHNFFVTSDAASLHINQDFTIGAGADTTPFNCATNVPNIHINGPDGHLMADGNGTRNFGGTLDVAGGTVTIGDGQMFAIGQNGISQSGGITEIASGGVLQAPATLSGGVLRGAGQITGSVTNTSGTVRPGTSPGRLTVTGNYTQGPGATLAVDVDGAAQGTQFDHLSVGGAASLDGTLAVVQGAGFDPQVSDTFPFLTSSSRTGTFAAITGASVPSGKTYTLDYPDAPDFGARLLVQPGARSDDVVVTDCDDPALATLTTVEGDLTIEDISNCDEISAPNLTEVTGNLTVDDVEATGSIDLTGVNVATGSITIGNVTVGDDIDLTGVNVSTGSITIGNVTVGDDIDLTGVNVSMGSITIGNVTVGGSIDLTGVNVATGSITIGNVTAGGSIDLSGAINVGGDIAIDNNGHAEVIPPSEGTVTGDLTLESTGTEDLDLGTTETTGTLTLEGTGYDEVGGTTGGADTSAQNARGDATMRVRLPDGSFDTPVRFTLTRLAPGTLPPEEGTGADDQPATIDPLAAYQFDFDVPTLNADATLSFDIHVDGLDAVTRDALLAALDAGTATMATRGDNAGATYRAFPVCTGTEVPAADGCVLIERLDADGNPTTGTPTTVRFSNVVGHFSTWAVVITEPIEQPEPNIAEAIARLDALRQTVEGSQLHDALKLDLSNKLRRASNKLQESPPQIGAACLSVTEFIAKVDEKAAFPQSRLDRATADAWIREAQTITALIDC